MKNDRLKTKVMTAVVFLAAMVFVSTAIAADFPYRKNYPKMTPISSEDLFKEYKSGNSLIVDVRTKIEFDVIHIKGAFLEPVTHVTFAKNIERLAQKHPGKKIAFYCNGVTCLKTYEAAEKAMAAGIANVYGYDAGVPAWVILYPRETLLLGKEVVDPGKQIIPESEFKKKCLSFDEFKSKSSSGMVIDVRDNMQRSGQLPGLEKAKTITLDDFIPNFVQKKVNQDKHLYIFDQVGKQINWLQYYLVDNGYQNYSFLEGGATAVLKKQTYKK